MSRIKCQRCREWCADRTTSKTQKLRANPPNAHLCLDCCIARMRESLLIQQRGQASKQAIIGIAFTRAPDEELAEPAEAAWQAWAVEHLTSGTVDTSWRHVGTVRAEDVDGPMIGNYCPKHPASFFVKGGVCPFCREEIDETE